MAFGQQQQLYSPLHLTEIEQGMTTFGESLKSVWKSLKNDEKVVISLFI